MMQRDINITIKLEDLTPFSIKVPIQQEEAAREAQRTVNHLYNSWKGKLGNLSSAELMGRIAFHLARKFEDLNTDLNQVENELTECEQTFDKILLEIQ